MTKVAVLDDWQGVAKTSADWAPLQARAEVVFFAKAFDNEDDAARQLADFDIVRILTGGGPQDLTHVFATYAFQVGIQSGDIPLGAAGSLFMFPILAVSAFFVLRGITRRSMEIAA